MPISISLSPLFFNLVRTLLHFFALPKNSTLLFSSDSALCVKKHNHRGWERRTSCQRKIRDEFLSLHHYFITSLLPLARGNSVGSAGGRTPTGPPCPAPPPPPPPAPPPPSLP